MHRGVRRRVAALRVAGGALALALALSCAPALAANYELRITAPTELYDALRTRTLIGRWIDEDAFDPAQLPLFVERAKTEAEAIAQAAGFFSAQVDVRLDPAPAQGVPVVHLVVDAGARTTVNRFELVLDGPAQAHALYDELVERWPLPAGSFFRSSVWQQAKRLLIDSLQQRGFVRARVADSRAEVDPERTTAGLTVRVDTGEQLDFGEVTVNGLERYDLSIVHALVPWIGEARTYDFDEVLRLQERLRTSGYFLSAEVLPDFAAVQADPQLTTVPIRIEVAERKTQRATFGIGYGTDEGLRGLFGYEHRNVFGRGFQLDSGLLLQSVRRRVFAGLRTPQKASGHFYQGGVRIERLDLQGELTHRQTMFVGEGKRTDDTNRFLSLQYQTEERELPVPGDVGGARALTLGYSWDLRRVDSVLDPRVGYTISAQLSGASEAMLSDRSFVRFHTRAMRFWSMPRDTAFEGGIVIGLLEVGNIFAKARDGIPSENLFRTGGTSTVRGYQYLSLGIPEGGAVVGGRVLAVCSLEYQHPIVSNWYAAGFVDVGDATDRWTDYKPVAGYGGGVRWRSPIGPINVDLAYGEAVNRWRFHLSVGFAF